MPLKKLVASLSDILNDPCSLKNNNNDDLIGTKGLQLPEVSRKPNFVLLGRKNIYSGSHFQ
uniref:Uncharacterized protein n=1 Tax=Lepeophtheirus salmonis TaxID=72036 RepID=A0A0K2TIC6_LEPSM